MTKQTIVKTILRSMIKKKKNHMNATVVSIIVARQYQDEPTNQLRDFILITSYGIGGSITNGTIITYRITAKAKLISSIGFNI